MGWLNGDVLMIIKIIVTLFLLVAQNFSLDAETKKLSFTMLEKAPVVKDLSGQEVEVRGFVYESKQGKVVLASQPNLKSCCVGSTKKIRNQIVLLGDLPEIPLQRAVTVQGYFVTDPTYGEDDELIGLYYLKNITLLNDFDDVTIYSLVVFIVIILLLIVGVVLYRRYN